MMLRRLKEDVEKSLQPKEETIIEVIFYLSFDLFARVHGLIVMHIASLPVSCNFDVRFRYNCRMLKRNTIEPYSKGIFRIFAREHRHPR